MTNSLITLKSLMGDPVCDSSGQLINDAYGYYYKRETAYGLHILRTNNVGDLHIRLGGESSFLLRFIPSGEEDYVLNKKTVILRRGHKKKNGYVPVISNEGDEDAFIALWKLIWSSGL